MVEKSNFSIRLGMTSDDFFNSNMKQLQKLSNQQKQKIANFWYEDKDSHITNEIELSMLEGFTSNKKGKIKMPQGNPSLFMNREYCQEEGFTNDYTDTFASEAPNYPGSKLIVEHYNNGQSVRVTWQQNPNEECILEDVLHDDGDALQRGGKKHTDDMADGFADYRFEGYSYNGGGGIIAEDRDLNGTFEKHYDYKSMNIKQHIYRMFNKQQ